MISPLITNGLGSSADNLILASAKLGIFEVIVGGSPPTIPPVIPSPGVGGGGGSTTHGVFPDRTKQWDDDGKRSIIIRVKYKDKTTEKMFLVSEKRAKFIIEVLNIINTTRSRIKVTVTNLKHTTLSVIAKIKNFGNKDNNE